MAINPSHRHQQSASLAAISQNREYEINRRAVFKINLHPQGRQRDGILRFSHDAVG
jgi:hypothetical protein